MVRGYSYIVILLFFLFLSFRLYLRQNDLDSSFARSRSSEAIRKISQSSSSTMDMMLLGDPGMWHRSRSLSDTQRTLDEAIRNLEQYMNEELTLDNRHERYSSNDSAMGESETVLSPPQSACSEPSTLSRNRQVFDSMDSAFSNTSSQTNSSDGVNVLTFELDSQFVQNHTRMSSGVSGVSGVSSVSPTTGSDSPELAASPQLGRKGPLRNVDTVSLPSLNTLSPESHVSPSNSTSKAPQPPQSSGNTHTWSGKSKSSSSKKKSLPQKGRHPSITAAGTYSPHRSPILNSKELFHSDPMLDSVSSDHTPTESTTNISMPEFTLGGNKLDFSDDCEGTVI